MASATNGKPVTCKHCNQELRFNFYIQAMRHMTNNRSQACKRIRAYRELSQSHQK